MLAGGVFFYSLPVSGEPPRTADRTCSIKAKFVVWPFLLVSLLIGLAYLQPTIKLTTVIMILAAIVLIAGKYSSHKSQSNDKPLFGPFTFDEISPDWRR
ncbi:hypothetical protein ACMYSL_14735 [Klebsiella sp. MISC125]|uniref:hypothetical protein n=1 Tax=Klebsiella sp. MISC125 TaxID=2755386 RepID=UPI003DA7A7FA